MERDSAKLKTEALLKDLWTRKAPVIREHLQVLERAGETLRDARLTPPLRSEAAISAHKLAGSLGMFGYPEGTRFARELEHLLDAHETPLPETYTALLRQLRASLPL